MALPTRVLRQVGPDPMESFHRELDTMFNRFFGGVADGGPVPFPVDVREDQDHIYVEADLPGFAKEDIDITLENQTLTITADRRQRQQQHKPAGEYLLNERRFPRLMRSFSLPPTVDEKQVDAKLADGVLSVTLNKREESKPRKIQVL